MASHDLNDKGAFVRCRRRRDSINGFENAVQCRICANGHVRAPHVVVLLKQGAEQAQEAEEEKEENQH